MGASRTAFLVVLSEAKDLAVAATVIVLAGESPALPFLGRLTARSFAALGTTRVRHKCDGPAGSENVGT
jgi:hypothetical protein